MTNDKPPKACLADFGFTTMVLDPQNPMSSSFTLEGGTVTFMAPELLAPTRYGFKNAVPTKEGDIYAFGLVILQVAALRHRCRDVFFLTTCQVLTGEQPFRGIKSPELAFRVSTGVRPAKPESAETIGISEPVWNLIQKCWDGNISRRPQIQEVVTGVANAATNWDVLTPPSVIEHVEDAVEEESDELEHGEFSSFRAVLPVFRPPLAQLEYSRLMKRRHLLSRVSILGNSAMGPLLSFNALRWNHMKNMLNLNFRIRVLSRLLLSVLYGNAKGSGTSRRRHVEVLSGSLFMLM